MGSFIVAYLALNSTFGRKSPKAADFSWLLWSISMCAAFRDSFPW